MDVMCFIQNFEETRKISRGCNSSFIALIRKTMDPLFLKEYRPINLVGCLYKILSKALALRLKKVMSKLVGWEQSAYVEGRSIMDGPLVLNEIFSWARKKKKRVMCLIH